MADEASTSDAFWEVMRGLPRQGVGSDTDTARALALCTDLPVAPRILDIGCGTGRQSLVLARATGGHVTAVDLHAPFLDELRANAASAGLSDRITTVQADMRELPFEAGTFDLVWSEGAAYAMGVAAALVAWRRSLRPGGYLALSDLVWTMVDRPAQAEAFFASGYPDMTDVDGSLARIADAGFELKGHFPLPESAWWDEYYTPLEVRLPALRERYRGDADAAAVIEQTAQEIDLRRHYRTSYDYQFFVTLKPGPA